MPTIAVITIQGVILPEAYIWWDEEATSLYRVQQQVIAAGEFDSLQLNICSPGGYCFEGWKIVDYLFNLGKPITTFAFGQCASFGTILHAMGSVREITKYCEWMSHRPWDYTWGNNLQIAKFNETLTKETNKYFDFLVERYNKPLEELTTLIGEDDVTLTPQETVDYGFSTAIHVPGPAASAKGPVLPGINAPLPADKLKKPVYMMTLGDRKINPDAPKEQAPTPLQSTQKPTTMAEKKQSIVSALKSALAFVSGSTLKDLDVALEDGRTMVTNSTGDSPVVGDTAEIDGTTAANGDYPSTSFGTITVTDGTISSITEDDSSDEDDDEGSSDSAEQPTTVAALQKENKQLKAQIKTLEARQTASENRIKAVLGDLESQEVPTQRNKVISTPAQSKDQADREQMLDNHKNSFKRKEKQYANK